MVNGKKTLIGVFVLKNKILSLMEKMKNEFNIEFDKVFVYVIDGNNSEYLITFKTSDRDKVLKNLPSSKVVHVKNGCIFTINALNKLIDEENFDSTIKNNEYEIDWSMHKDELIMLNKGTLSISKLSKVEDKSEFFK